jgi:hypothetical protein
VKATCVITSIFPPTASVASFAQSAAFAEVIVVGDRKSPDGYDLTGSRFIPVSEQESLPWGLGRDLPFNHYCRKMLGYLEAAAGGADIIFDTDDDNKLIDGQLGRIWEESCLREVVATDAAEPYVNIYRLFSDQPIWPRGLPLELIRSSISQPLTCRELDQPAAVGIWQGLANGDPDVDAIYRLTNNQPCDFQSRPAVALPAGVCCPFNSQNTAFRRELLPLMYLPAFVSFRYTDILRGLVAQPILWAAGLQLAFTAATVFQDRNVHNYLRDMESEVPMYLTGRSAFDTAAATVSANSSISDNLRAVYAALETKGIVEARERSLLDLWLSDCDTALAAAGMSCN